MSRERSTLTELNDRARNVSPDELREQLDLVRDKAPDLYAMMTVTTLRVGLLSLYAGHPAGDDPIPLRPIDAPLLPLSADAPRLAVAPRPLDLGRQIASLVHDPLWRKWFQTVVTSNHGTLPCEELCRRLRDSLIAQWIGKIAHGEIVEPPDVPCDCV